MSETQKIQLMTGARAALEHLSSPKRILFAIEEIERNIEENPGVVFDYAKSMIETTCKTIIKETGGIVDNNSKLQSLVSDTCKSTIRIPTGHPEPEKAAKRLSDSLRSLSSLTVNLGEIRNKEGELGHGKELDHTGLSTIHAELVARAADAVVKYLIDAHRDFKKDAPSDGPISYEANEEFNTYIDDQIDPYEMTHGSYKASRVLYVLDYDVYFDAYNEYLNLETDE